MSLPVHLVETQAAFEHAAIGMGLTNPKGGWLRVNRALCELTGYTEAELLATDCLGIIHPLDVPAEVALIKQMLAGEIETALRERRYIHKLGHTVWMDVATALVRGGDGKPLSCMLQVMNVTQRRQIDMRFRSIFSQAMIGIAYTTTNGRILEANPKLCEILGYTAHELQSLTTRDLTYPDDRDCEGQQRQELVAGSSASFTGEKRLVRRNGEALWIKRTVALAHEATSGEPCLIQVFEDISEQVELEQRFRATFDHAAVGIIHSSLDRHILLVNRKFCEMVGYSADEIQHGSVQRLHHPEDTDADQHLEKRLVAGEIDTFSFEKRYVRKNGSVFCANRTVSLARDGAGRPKYFIRVVEDVSARKEAEEKLLHMAYYDSLTSLPQRALFYDRLAQAMAQAGRRGGMVAMMFLDLDRFKMVNDTFGHAMGDLMLQQVADRLTKCVRAGDTVGRLSGDEFGIVLGDLRSAAEARLVAQSIVHKFRKPFRLDSHEHRMTTSIGISMYPTDSHVDAALIKAADVAMYRAKEDGRNTFQFYNDVAHPRA
jgi:diguanylate cyclase (GGDEF)-like protein/PAS domain S-box-containing protein